MPQPRVEAVQRNEALVGTLFHNAALVDHDDVLVFLAADPADPLERCEMRPQMAEGWQVSDDRRAWTFTLRDGFLKGSAYVKATGVVNTSAVAGLVTAAQVPVAPSADSFEVVLTPDSGIYDGRYANNAWLQEAPDPVTKLTWDNAALIGAATFRSMGLKEGQMVKITVNGTELKIPAIEAPGHVSHSISISAGYGQEWYQKNGFQSWRAACR